MLRRLLAAATLVTVLVTACGLTVKPATAARPVAAGSMERAMRAAMAAASETDWVPKTVSAENGYLLAERENRVVGRADRADSYKLEVTIPPNGSGALSAKVTPPPGIMGGESPEKMVTKFLDAFERAMKK